MTGDGTHYIVETKGLEDINVANKDRAALLWCENTIQLTGKSWAYVKALQTACKQLQPTEFGDLFGRSASTAPWTPGPRPASNGLISSTMAQTRSAPSFMIAPCRRGIQRCGSRGCRQQCFRAYSSIARSAAKEFGREQTS
jgi:hypothetical protein